MVVLNLLSTVAKNLTRLLILSFSNCFINISLSDGLTFSGEETTNLDSFLNLIIRRPESRTLGEEETLRRVDEPGPGVGDPTVLDIKDRSQAAQEDRVLLLTDGHMYCRVVVLNQPHRTHDTGGSCAKHLQQLQKHKLLFSV